MKPRILIVDDERRRGAVLCQALGADYECQCAFTLDEAFTAVDRWSGEAALVDYDLGRHSSGLELLQALREVAPRTLRVLYAEFFCEALVRDATRIAGAHAVVDARRSDFAVAVRDALERLLSLPRPDSLVSQPRVDDRQEPEWFAHSAHSLEFAGRLRAAAEGAGPVFLFGEHGTGKHLAAGLLRRWRADRRAPGPREAGVALLLVPPLRQRIEDIPALAQHCLERHARQGGEPVRHLTNQALDDLLRREWWGNVRELHGVLIRACQRAGLRLGLSAADLPHDVEPQLQPSQSAKDEGQRDCVLRQLRAAGNVSGAARLEGISRTNYIRLMHRLGIIRADTVGAAEPEAAEAEARPLAMRPPRATVGS